MGKATKMSFFACIRTSLAIVSFFAMTSLCSAQEPPKKQPCIIGDATMLEDGTIVLKMRRTCDGIHVSGTKKYETTNPQYRDVLDHMGGMKPGETKLVPAWDDDTRPDKR